jgi:hypothetical protein
VTRSDIHEQGVIEHLKIFTEYPAIRNDREHSRNLVTCGKESARYYTKVFRLHAMQPTVRSDRPRIHDP